LWKDLENLKKQISAGPNFLFPFVDKISHVLSTNVEKIEIADVGITKNLSQFEYEILVFYKMSNPKLAAYSTPLAEDYIRKIVNGLVRKDLSKYTMEECLSKIGETNESIETSIKESIKEWGYELQWYSLTNVIPQKELITAATREKELEILELRKQALISEENLKAQARSLEFESKKRIITEYAKLETELIDYRTAATIKSFQKLSKEFGTQDAVSLFEAQESAERQHFVEPRSDSYSYEISKLSKDIKQIQERIDNLERENEDEEDDDNEEEEIVNNDVVPEVKNENEVQKAVN